MPEWIMTFAQPVASATWLADSTAVLMANQDGTAMLRSIAGEVPVTFAGHRGPVYQAAASPTGTMIATASADHDVRLFPRYGGAPRLLRGHTNRVVGVLWLDEERLVTASLDESVRVWSSGGEVLAELRPNEGGASSLVRLDGDVVAVALQDEGFRLWDLASGTSLGRIYEERSCGSHLSIGDDGRMLVVFWDSVRVLDAEWREVAWFPMLTQRKHLAVWLDHDRFALGRGEKIRLGTAQEEESLLEGHTTDVASLARHPDRRHLISGSVDGEVRLWSLETRDCVGVVKTMCGAVTQLTPSPDGQFLLSVASGDTIRIDRWDNFEPPRPTCRGMNRSRAMIPSIQLAHPGSSANTFTPGGLLVSGGNDRKLRFFANGELAHVLDAGRTLRFHWSQSRRTFLTTESIGPTALVRCDADPEIVAWLYCSGDCARFTAHGELVVVQKDPDDFRYRGRLQVRDAETGSVLHMLGELRDSAWGIDVSSDGKRALVRHGEEATLLEPFSGRVIATLSGFQHRCEKAEFSSDGSRLVTSSADEVRLWNSVDGTSIARLESAGRGPQFAWIPDTDHLVTGGTRGTLREWTRDGELVREWPTGHGSISNITVSSCGKLMFAVSATGRIGRALLWTADGDLTAEFKSGDGGVVHFSSDRTRFLFWETKPFDTQDCTVLLGDVESRGSRVLLSGHSRNLDSPTSNSIHLALFSPDDSLVLTTMWHDDRARLWSAHTGEPLAILGGHGDNVRCPTFSPDGHLLVTCGGDHVKVWNVPGLAVAQ